MILTFTPNPSLDRAAMLTGPLLRGGTNRLTAVTTLAGGKGVNVSAAVRRAGRPTLAILPADADDPIAEALRHRDVPAQLVPVGHRARTNMKIVQPDGTTTEFNEPGEHLTPENVSALVSALMADCPGSTWLCLCGSLPPGAPLDWYVRLVTMAREVGVRVVVDTSGPALDAVLAVPHAAPDLISPNATELSQVTGIDLLGARRAGDIGPAIEAARLLVAGGIPHVLATLGDLGAISVTADEAWAAHAVGDVHVASTASAGDATLAGWLLADLDGLDWPSRLGRAVAYGTACVARSDSDMPYPDEADRVRVEVRRV